MNTRISGSEVRASLMRAVPPFFPARVMTPAQVAEAVAGRATEVQERTNGKWHLCGDVSDEMFAVLAKALRSETPMRISAFRTPSGAAYGVISHQVHGFAHRYLLPLYETGVVNLLSDLQRGGQLAFLLGRNGNSQALLIEPPTNGLSGFGPVAAMAAPLKPEKVGEVISELSEVIRAIALPAQIPTLRKGEPVAHVDVSAVMPVSALQSLLSAQGGRE